jgi:Ca2+-binding RTX toxin-like protein
MSINSRAAQRHHSSTAHSLNASVASTAHAASAPPANNGDNTLVGGIGNDQLFGGNGNDILQGGGGNDALFGENGDDTLIGGPGVDLMSGGRGNDLLIWNPGDGNDTLDGGQGFDTMLFNGSNAAETFDFSAKVGGGALFTRNVGNIRMDLASVEKVTLNTLGGADNIHIHDPSGSGVTEFDINLGVNGLGDGASDTIFLDDDDGVQVVNNGNGDITILGVSGATVHITGFEAGTDHLVINGDPFQF